MQPQPHGESGMAAIAEQPRDASTLRLAPVRRRLSDRAILGANLLLFLSAGTLLCFWFWRNSDWFEEFGAVLTFSGALSWLAMALRIVPEAKLANVQGVFFERVFENRRALGWHAAALAAVVAGTFCLATVQIEPLHESVERPVVVSRAGEATSLPDFWAAHLADEDFSVLKPGQTLRVVVPVWGRSARVVVAVGGYPEKTLTLSPWERRELIAPSSFRRAVVLLRPTVGLMGEIALGQRTLRVTWSRAGQPAVTKETPLDGRPIWLGCGDHVEVPALWREAWGREEGGTRHVAKWLFPSALPLGIELQPGDRLHAEVRGPSGIDWKLDEPHVITPLLARAEFLPDIIRIGK